MGNVFESIDDRLAEWIQKQHLFFVATAPLSKDGSVNCSPKGGDSFRILGETEAAYHDLTGSGVETIAHLRENGRIVILFCAFEGPPKIVRLHGLGTVVTEGHPKYDELSAHFPPHVGTRSFIHIDIRRVSDSCGYGVPLFDFKADRETLDKQSSSYGADRLREYRKEHNAVSIDGLPGLDADL